MGIKLISQPDKSHCCGQACVAMVAGVTLEVAKKAVGKAGSTSTRVLRKGLEKLGVSVRKGRLIAIRGNLGKLPEVCILKIRMPFRVSGWHWVLKFRTKIYCPSWGVFMVATYEAETDNTISSYLEILTDSGLLGDSESGYVKCTKDSVDFAPELECPTALIYTNKEGFIISVNCCSLCPYHADSKPGHYPKGGHLMGSSESFKNMIVPKGLNAQESKIVEKFNPERYRK